MSVIDKVFKKIDEEWDEQVYFLQKLGRYESVLMNENSIQRYLAQTLRGMGLETEEFVPDIDRLSKLPGYSPVNWSYDGRPIVVGKLESKGEKLGKSLILQGHIDVVSPEPRRLWDYDPWKAEIVENKMYGRGLCDMKSGVSAMIYAVKAIQESGIELDADLIIETVYEEECTGNGALATLERGYTADGCLIPEPTDLKATKATVGCIWMQVKVIGSGAHARSASKAINAIEKAYILINSLKKYKDEINNRPKHKDFKNVDHPLNVNVGVINSGDWTSTVPSECTFEVRIGLYPDQDPHDIKKEITMWLLQDVEQDAWLKNTPPEITFNGFHAHGVSLDDKQEIFTYLNKSHQLVNKSELESEPLTGVADIRFYDLFYDIQTTCYGPKGGNMHAPNEWVDLDSIKDCTKVYAAFILEWCGIKQN